MKTITEYDFENFPEYAIEIADGMHDGTGDDLGIYRRWFNNLRLPMGCITWSFLNDPHFSWTPEFGLAAVCVTAKLKILE